MPPPLHPLLMSSSGRLPLGAIPRKGGTLFRVWAPNAQAVELLLEPSGATAQMKFVGSGYFEYFAAGVQAGDRYRYRLDGGDAFPDPASRFQPEGVHGPSMVIAPGGYVWHDEGWKGVAQEELVFYELHVGTFSPEGTFAGVQERLEHLKGLGVTAVELMPVADFPGRWNWGYDHAALYAPSRAYGMPDDLRDLVDVAHDLGMAVFLDVIYNHLGPDGAYVAAFAPMFTGKHHTPWGDAINLDDRYSEGVRHLFIDNALYWLREFHFDGLRLDATNALKDDSAVHFLAELAEAVDAFDQGPPRLLFAEDHRNLSTLVLPRRQGGYGLDGVWVDDFHHQVRNLTAGDVESYYAAYAGTTAKDIAATLRQGWFYTGQRNPATGEPRGTDPSDVRPDQCVFCIQNHDQIGNRAQGNRLSDDVAPEVFRAASALLLFAPELPLLFMGQEWAASAPFQFFTDHNEELGRLVTEGRKKEFEKFSGFGGQDVPDPQDEATFRRSKLDWDELDRGGHAGVLKLYRDLLHLRKDLGGDFEVVVHGDQALVLQRGPHLLLLTLGRPVVLPLPEEAEVLLHTEADVYAPDVEPPEVADGEVRFCRAGALVARLPSE